MRYLAAITGVILFICAACGGKQEKTVKIPEGILHDTVFAQVLADFALAESAANINITGADFKKLDSVYAFDPLKDNGVTQAQYDSTVNFYVRHPELYKKVYEQVLEVLSEIQAGRNAVKKDTASK